ncbi:hypothetical protein TSUD_245480 [Trifolium subterraneum]|uniref:Uncharacterized protein n=1 Tax=Trifolium subterraneum TaxID=3900 RepID=A0A2Z6P319_TRISU|nr:hypothetical protein TSUD_245480 [Trifolium subterraneum]
MLHHTVQTGEGRDNKTGKDGEGVAGGSKQTTMALQEGKKSQGRTQDHEINLGACISAKKCLKLLVSFTIPNPFQQVLLRNSYPKAHDPTILISNLRVQPRSNSSDRGRVAAQNHGHRT